MNKRSTRAIYRKTLIIKNLIKIKDNNLLIYIIIFKLNPFQIIHSKLNCKIKLNDPNPSPNQKNKMEINKILNVIKFNPSLKKFQCQMLNY